MSEIERVVFERGHKVNLRPLGEEGDTERSARWINDPDVRRYLETYLPVTRQEEKEWIDGLSKSKTNEVTLAIETAEGIHIGNTGLHRIKWRDGTAVTGTLIGEKSYWNKGYGTEAKMLLLDYAFNTLNLRKICSQVIAFNERSLAVQKKCGYKEEGILREHIFRNGQYWDLHNLAVFREDFGPIWQRWIEAQKQK